MHKYRVLRLLIRFYIVCYLTIVLYRNKISSRFVAQKLNLHSSFFISYCQGIDG